VTKAALESLKLEPIEIAPGDQRFFLPGDRALFDAFKPPKDPRYSLLGSIDSLLVLRSENLKSQISAGALADLSGHAIVDHGRLVGLWEYDLPTESIAWTSFGKKDKAIQEAVTRTENFAREQLGDARSFSLDSPTSRAPRIAALRKAAASA
jgi:hypothetical protein